MRTLNCPRPVGAARAPRPAAAGHRRTRGAPARRLVAARAPPATGQRRSDRALPGRRWRRSAWACATPTTSRRRGTTSTGSASCFPGTAPPSRDRGVVDFDEQIYAAIETILADGPFRAAMQRRCRHLLVDEFQDLTPAHVLLIRLLSLPALDVFGVGDDDQCIYGHAGADPGVPHRLSPRCSPAPASTPCASTIAAPPRSSRPRRRCSATTSGASPRRSSPAPHNDATPGALRVVEHDPDGGAAAIVGVVAGWLAEPGVEPRLDRRAGPGQLDPPGAPRRPTCRRASRSTPCVTPDLLGRTGLRAALAYLRIASQPGRLRRRRRRRDPAPAVPRAAAVVSRAHLPAPDVDRRDDRRAGDAGSRQGPAPRSSTSPTTCASSSTPGAPGRRATSSRSSATPSASVRR